MKDHLGPRIVWMLCFFGLSNPSGFRPSKMNHGAPFPTGTGVVLVTCFFSYTFFIIDVFISHDSHLFRVIFVHRRYFVIWKNRELSCDQYYISYWIFVAFRWDWISSFDGIDSFDKIATKQLIFDCVRVLRWTMVFVFVDIVRWRNPFDMISWIYLLLNFSDLWNVNVGFTRSTYFRESKLLFIYCFIGDY